MQSGPNGRCPSLDHKFELRQLCLSSRSGGKKEEKKGGLSRMFSFSNLLIANVFLSSASWDLTCGFPRGKGGGGRSGGSVAAKPSKILGWHKI